MEGLLKEAEKKTTFAKEKTNQDHSEGKDLGEEGQTCYQKDLPWQGGEVKGGACGRLEETSRGALHMQACLGE